MTKTPSTVEIDDRPVSVEGDSRALNLKALIDRKQNISEGERAWYYKVLADTTLQPDERISKVEFYLWAADMRTRIVEITPTEHKDQVHEQVTDMLDSSIQRQSKPRKLEEMHQALNAFWGVQNVVQNEARRIGFLPDNFEARIWDRFRTMYLAQGRDLLDLNGIKQFEASIKRTFDHLAKMGEQQEKLRARLGKEKFFMTRDAKTGKSMREVTLKQFESQMYHWLDNSLSLKAWSKSFSDLVDKQMPEKIKAFNEIYNQVYTPTFWAMQKSFSPQEFPRFAAAFNFSTEADFLHKYTPKQIKQKTKEVHKALMGESDEYLSSFFGVADKKKWSAKMRSVKSPKLAQAMKVLWVIKQEREQREKQAQRTMMALQTFDRRRFVLEGAKMARGLRKRFGTDVFTALGFGALVADLEAREERINQLKSELKISKGFEAQYEIQQQLLDLDATFYFPDNSPGAKEHKTAQLKEQFEIYISTNNLRAARNVAAKLKKYDAVESYNLFKKLEKEEEKNQRTKESKKQATETAQENPKRVETSHDKLTKIRFYERCIEHAEKVKEACTEVGIPTDDPEFWGQDGIRNRVAWLKKKGLYHLYEKYNSSDPNIPKDAQAGGFRFRWLDGRGSDLSGAKAEQGMKYLDRYKESGYMLCALAGAFSINWRGSSDPTYSPDMFITKMREEIARV